MNKKVILAQVEETDRPASEELDQRLTGRGKRRAHSEARPPSKDGVVIGRLIGFRDVGQPLVAYPGQPRAVVTRTAVDLCADHIGHEVILLFEAGEQSKPIVVGRIRTSAGWPISNRPIQVEVDAEGRRLTLAAEDQLVLRCGKASITLTRAGKLIIQGAYVSQQSSGVLRIKGGSVQIN